MHMIEILRKIYHRFVPRPVRLWLRRQLFGPPLDTAQAAYKEVARFGADSPNPWIRKSATIGGWLFAGEHEFLWELACRQTHGDVIEIGTWMGKSACILAGACKDHAPGTQVVCVDTFCMTGTPEQEAYHKRLVAAGGTFYQFLNNAQTHNFIDAVVPVAALSSRALAVVRGPFRMAFVDGAHDRENCSRDVELCLPLLTQGGVIAVHDTTGGHWPGVEQYVQEVMMLNPNLRCLGTRGSITAFEKVAPIDAS